MISFRFNSTVPAQIIITFLTMQDLPLLRAPLNLLTLVTEKIIINIGWKRQTTQCFKLMFFWALGWDLPGLLLTIFLFYERNCFIELFNVHSNKLIKDFTMLKDQTMRD